MDTPSLRARESIFEGKKSPNKKESAAVIANARNSLHGASNSTSLFERPSLRRSGERVPVSQSGSESERATSGVGEAARGAFDRWLAPARPRRRRQFIRAGTAFNGRSALGARRARTAHA